MISVNLEEYRCKSCRRLLFKGTLGMGFIEVKCSRCGTVSLIHSFDKLLKGQPHAYILVYGSDGHIIATSKSATRLLQRNFKQTDTIGLIDPQLSLPPLPNSPTYDDLSKWEEMHRQLPSKTVHTNGQNTPIEVNARYYPIASHADVYTVAIFYVLT